MENERVEVVVYDRWSESRDQDGYWDRGDYTCVCIGGKVHVRYAKRSYNDQPTPKLSIRGVGACDGSCHPKAEIPSEVMEAAEKFLEKK
jgi:hypothetical protein